MEVIHPLVRNYKKALSLSGISYEEVKDSGIIADFGFETVPRLQTRAPSLIINNL